LEVFDAEGKLIATGEVADFFVADISETGVASHKKALHLPIPSLRPGCRIELCVTTQDISPPKQLPYSEHYFCTSFPTARQTVVVLADPAQFVWNASAKLQPKVSADYVSCQLDGLPMFQIEPYEDDLDSFAPVLRIVDKQTNWKTELEEYQNSIKDLLPVSDSVRQLASDLTRTAADQDAKISALLHYVQNQLTYKAIEFGRRSRVMNSAEKTLRNKYGDCKDHALLLCQLLQAVDIPAQLTLVNTRGVVSETTPSLDQFNHMIVCVHDSTTDRFIDATVKDIDPTLTVPFGLAGRSAMLVSSTNPKLLAIPDYPPDSNAVEVQRHVRISGDGTLDAEDRLTYSGYFAAGMRSYLKTLDPTQRKSTMEAYFPSEANVQVQNVAFESVEETQRPLVITVKYKCEHALQQNDQQLIGRLLAPWETRLLAAPAVEQRAAPFWLQLPLRIRDAITVELPAGYACAVADSPAKGSSQFFDWDQQARSQANQLIFSCDALRHSGHFPATQYPDYRDAEERVRQLFTPSLVLKPVDK
jgi:hypothetical protein